MELNLSQIRFNDVKQFNIIKTESNSVKQFDTIKTESITVKQFNSDRMIIQAREWLQSGVTAVKQFNSHLSDGRKKGIQHEPLPDLWRSVEWFNPCQTV